MKMVFTKIILLILFSSCNLNKAPIFTELQPNIFRLNNQTFYGEKVNTYLIELDDKVLLFDIPTYSQDIEDFITSFKKPVVAILSHGSCGIKDGTLWQKKIGLKVYAHKADFNHPWLRMKPDVFFEQMPEFGNNIEVIHTPGHSAGAVCLLEKKSKSLFTGDTFYGNKDGRIRDFSRESPEDYENPSDRIESCKKLLNYDFENVYPFHYESIEKDGKKRLTEYLKDHH